MDANDKMSMRKCAELTADKFSTKTFADKVLALYAEVCDKSAELRRAS